MNSKKPEGLVDISMNVPAQIIVLANRLNSSVSKVYRKKFGVGTLEGRILGMIAFKPNQSAARLSEFTGFDKAAISRGLNKLLEKDLVVFEAAVSDPRRKTWKLSEKGKGIYAEILDMVLERDRLLTHGFTKKEKSDYLNLTLKLIANAERL